ncbi:hypothetical protein AB0F41_24355, partial [Nocardia sp. NPDC024068]
RLLRREPGGDLVTHADLSGVTDKPWNDIVVDHESRGLTADAKGAEPRARQRANNAVACGGDQYFGG